MATQTLVRNTESNLLRQALRVDALFEAVCGLGLLVGAWPLASLTGLNTPLVMMAVGSGLLAAAFWIWRLATAVELNRRTALLVAEVNLISALGGSVVLLAGWLPLTLAGSWLFGIACADLALLAVFQFIGTRQS